MTSLKSSETVKLPEITFSCVIFPRYTRHVSLLKALVGPVIRRRLLPKAHHARAACPASFTRLAPEAWTRHVGPAAGPRLPGTDFPLLLPLPGTLVLVLLVCPDSPLWQGWSALSWPPPLCSAAICLSVCPRDCELLRAGTFSSPLLSSTELSARGRSSVSVDLLSCTEHGLEGFRLTVL